MARTGLTLYQRAALLVLGESINSWDTTAAIAGELDRDVRSTHSILQALERKRMIEGVLHEGHWWWRLAERGAALIDF